MPPENKPTKSADAGKIWLHWLFTTLFAAAFAFVLAGICLPSRLPVHSEWPEAILILLATAATLSALARRMPLQNVLLATFIIALMGGGVTALGATTGIPFGPFIFGSEIGPQLFKTLPWVMPFIWVTAILNSRGVGRLILRPWRKTRTYGFWLIGLTALLTLLFVLAMDPFASRVEHYWLWMPTKFPVTWQGAPFVNFLSWGFVTLLILAFATPALIKKQPGQKGSPDFHPLAFWLGAILLFGTATALYGLWSATAVDAAIGIVTAVFAVRGGLW
jgi:putative membrane protein